MTDDGSVSDTPRNEYFPAFLSANADVDLNGTRTKWGTAGWDVQKETPIAVDDSFYTEVNTPFQDDVWGQFSLIDQTGDRALGGATVELVGGGPSHAASFSFFSEDGTFSYTPATDFQGIDSFTYRIDDRFQWYERDTTTGAYTYSEHNYSNVATVWIEVGPPVEAIIEADGLVDDLLILAFNDDDDTNANGTIELDERNGPYSSAPDLVPVSLSSWLRYDVYQKDFVASLTVGHPNAVRLWYDAERTTELIPSISLAGTTGVSWLLSEMPSTVWIEAIAMATTWLTVEIAGQWQSLGTDMTFQGLGSHEVVRTIVLQTARFDLSVDNDTSLGGPNDLARNYLPGYEGDVPKVSTGTTFNEPQYVGQEMKLVLDGVGSNLGIDAVKFTIVTVSVKPGFATNATDPEVEGDNKNDDYSFDSPSDLRNATGVLLDTRAYVDFWAKDYGGEALLRAEVLKDNKTMRLFYLEVPLDRDADGIADIWEIQKVKDWNAQFATSLPTTLPRVLNYVTPNEDLEKKDPDGPNTDGGTDMTAHAAAGDGRKAFDEYRGFILDGGGHDWDGNNAHPGGHVRLNPAYKEVLVEVDAMANVPNMPDRNGIQSWMDAVTRGASQKTDGAGVRMLYVIENMSTPYSDFAGTEEDSPDELWWTYCLSQRHALLTSFTHFQFADKLGNDPLDPDFVGSDVAGQAGVIGADRLAGIFLSTATTFAGYAETDLNTFAKSAISHELLHTLTHGKGDKDAGGHFADTNGNGTKGEVDDSGRLLYDRDYIVTSDKLAANINDMVTTIPLHSTAGVPTSGVAVISSQAGGIEYVVYSGMSGNSLTGCSRGAFDSGAEAHDANSLVGFERDRWAEFRQLRYGLGVTKAITVR